MPIIKITQEMIDKTKRVDAGFHRVILREITEDAAKDKKSINTKFSFQVISDVAKPLGTGSNKDRYISDNANSKAIMITLKPLLCALEDLDPDSLEPQDIDLDKLVGKECFVQVQEEMYQERPVSKISVYLPLSKEVDLTQ
jgi:hypothetical protein